MTDVSDLIGDEPPLRPLSARESLFVAEYMVDFCQWKALMRADGGEPMEKAWRELSSEVMKRPPVKAEVQRRVATLTARIGATAVEVRREIARMALFDPAHITGVSCPEDIANLPEDVRRAIVGWSWDKRNNFVVKLAKEGALEMLGRHHGLFKDRVEHSGPNGGPVQSVAVLDASGLSTEALSEIMRARDAAQRG